MSSEDSTDESESDDAESVEEEETPEADESAEEAEESAEAEETGGGHDRAGRDQSPGFLGTPAESDLIKEWATFIAATFGLIGVLIGLQFFVFNVIDEQIVSLDVSGSGGFGQAFSAAFVGLSMSLVAFAFSGIAIALSAVVGAYFGWKLEVADDLAYKAAAICGAAGTFVLFVLSAFFMGTAMDDVSAELGGIIMNGVGVAIIAAIAGAGAVWIARNQSPSSLGQDLDSPGPVDVDPSD